MDTNKTAKRMTDETIGIIAGQIVAQLAKSEKFWCCQGYTECSSVLAAAGNAGQIVTTLCDAQRLVLAVMEVCRADHGSISGRWLTDSGEAL
jgi:hypothetical protein